MARHGMQLEGIQVDSKPARQLPEAQRQISPRGYSLPLKLATVADPEHLRMRIGAAAAAFGRGASRCRFGGRFGCNRRRPLDLRGGRSVIIRDGLGREAFEAKWNWCEVAMLAFVLIFEAFVDHAAIIRGVETHP